MHISHLKETDPDRSFDFLFALGLRTLSGMCSCLATKEVTYCLPLNMFCDHSCANTASIINADGNDCA